MNPKRKTALKGFFGMLLLGVGCVGFSHSTDLYAQWQAQDASTNIQRKLTSNEQIWLTNVADSDHYEDAQLAVLSAEIGFQDAADVDASSFQQELRSKVDHTFRAPKYRMTYDRLTSGIRIEQSGQSITLPELAPIPQEATEFLIALRAWMSRDLSSLLFLIKIAQQETGWSDFEVVQLMELYSATVLRGESRQAFLAAFWIQANYAVQLGLIDGRWQVLLGLKRPIPSLPLIEQGHQVWFANRVPEERSIRLLQTPYYQKGQNVRLLSVNDRAQTTQFVAREFWFENKDDLQSIQLELPAHWSSIQRRPLPAIQFFSEPVPNYLFEQLQSLMAGETSTEQVRHIVRWLRDEFETVDASLSIQQSLLGKQQTDSTRLFWLAKWWRFLTQGSVAIVEADGQIHLALELKEVSDTQKVVLKAKKQWWLFSSKLLANPTFENAQSAKWTFLP